MSALLTRNKNILIFSVWLALVWQTTMAVTIDNDWWQHAVIYQIYPRSFMDSNDDGVGDLKGIIAKLPYLAATGITATWLSPIYASPMVDFGYDVSDFKAIQPEYGSMQDFEDLIAEANKLGIKVLLDFVPNHSSDQCEWFIKSAARVKGYEDFYIWADGKVNAKGERVPPNNWQSVFYGSAWTWHPQRKQYYLHQFTAEQPDLNYRNARVVAAMDEVITFWLDKGVVGFRIDAVNHLFEDMDLKDEPLSGKTDDPNSYDYTEHIYTKDLPEVYDMLQHWRRLLDEYTMKHGGAVRIMMTEAYAAVKPLMDYYENAAGQLGAHFPFNFNFITDLNATADARDFVHNIQKWLTYMPPAVNAKQQHVANWVMGNHDNPRVASRFGEDSVDLMNMLLMTLPGVAITYNGEEIGMLDYRDISYDDTVDPPARNVGPIKYKTVSRDPERTPFQWNATKNAGFSNAAKTWLPVHPNYVRLNLAQQLAANKSHYQVYKALVALRKMPVLAKGRLNVAVLSREVFAITRTLKGHADVVAVFNIGTQAQLLNLTALLDITSKLKVLVADSKSSYETGHIAVASNISLSSREAIVLTNGFGFNMDDRRALIKTLLKSLQIIMVGALFYNLWNKKWTKLNFNRELF